MKSRGISGFGAIFLIIVLLVCGYVAYQVGRVYLTYNQIAEKVEHAAKTGYVMSNNELVEQLIKEAKDARVELNPDSIFIDRSITDSLRIYVAYDDSSSIFDLFAYKRHLVVDKTESVKVRF